MKIHQARKEKLRGSVCPLPADLVGVPLVVQLLEGWWAVVEGLSCAVRRHQSEH